METDENDKLNLKSVLSQYVAVVMTSDKELMKKCHVICTEQDYEKLTEFMEISHFDTGFENKQE